MIEMFSEIIANDDAYSFKSFAEFYLKNRTIFGCVYFPETLSKYVAQYGYDIVLRAIQYIAEIMEVSHGEGTE